MKGSAHLYYGLLFGCQAFLHVLLESTQHHGLQNLNKHTHQNPIAGVPDNLHPQLLTPFNSYYTTHTIADYMEKQTIPTPGPFPSTCHSSKMVTANHATHTHMNPNTAGHTHPTADYTPFQHLTTPIPHPSPYPFQLLDLLLGLQVTKLLQEGHMGDERAGLQEV